MREQEFFEKMAAVWLEISTLKDEAQAIEQQMKELERAGMVKATIHTRSDNGGMELLHPTGSDYEKQTGRRREYIGKKPEAQRAAKARVERFHQHYTLKGELGRVTQRIKDIEHQISLLEMSALGRQAELFSEVGTTCSPDAAGPVPTDYNRLTPQMVIDYFKRSPILAAMADDVQAVLGKIEWAEVQKAA